MRSRPLVLPSGEAPAVDPPRERWLLLALLSFAVLLAMSLWFTASASAPHFTARFDLPPGRISALTTAVQLGFVAGTAFVALFNLADLLPSRWLFTGCALAAAIANALLLAATSFEATLACRFATGALLAGVYPPAMKMAATWFRHARGLAIGTVVGALTVGKAAPYLVQALADTVHPVFVITSTSLGAVLAAALVAAAYRDGPFAFPRRPFSWSLVGTSWSHRPTRLAIAAYLGHMWELYAMWATIAAFFLHTLALHDVAASRLTALAGILAFAAIGAGGAGSVIAGVWADRWGRENVAMASMVVSGACALVIGWLTWLPIPLLCALALVWGFAIVADSAQFSALVTELAPAHAVGTALTVQTSLGFALTALTIWGCAAAAARFGWGVAFSMLAIGPALGVLALLRLKRLRRRA